MNSRNRVVSIVSVAVILVGVALLVLNLVFGDRFNVALPLVFYVLSGGFFILIYRFQQEWSWASYLYIPALLLAAFGLIFTLNVLTLDWSSWAYAWLLLPAAIGIGMLLAGRGRAWPAYVNSIAWGAAIGGVTFFGVFGVIKGGQVIQIVAPLLLVAAGISIRLLVMKPKASKPLADRSEDSSINSIPASNASEASTLLSSREIEVLRLIDKGLTNQQIAVRLSVAESTVKTHINNIYNKLDVQTRAQALAKVRGTGIIKE